MGYMRLHAIIVSSPIDELLDAARAKAHELFDAIPERRSHSLVSPIVHGLTNGYRSFFVAPDGSKEWWPTSDAADRCRDQFIEWLESQAYNDGSSSLRWVEVQFGDENGLQRVLRASNLRGEGGSDE